ncbi:hypothetical protein CRV15_35170 (plasmid) [Streptomyces clavuligerus]|uniref:Uncharacterized protein n=1 Tax=Streptomyces clavuligerus TaxID=1901 RepID=B5GLS3_STRCL|nr:hypothetical protein SSCG_00297 [Streptomyces clavuligerus]EFG04932.1 Hypothetical protein SCLAV_p1450 [Streptomyces clavuligerus]QCS10761.1 hypothetical protein CRV15_35170 [Streptomyces clavuligerus]QPJ97204.1 hypothetical protein GE265_29315 [Streptomyces clavuligerus]
MEFRGAVAEAGRWPGRSRGRSRGRSKGRSRAPAAARPSGSPTARATGQWPCSTGVTTGQGSPDRREVFFLPGAWVRYASVL